MKKQLKKDASFLRVSLVWDSDECDLDLSAFLLNAKGKAEMDEDLIFYNHTASFGEAVTYDGDNRGNRFEMNESMSVRPALIPVTVNKVVFCATIHAEGQTFRDAKNLRFVVTAAESPKAENSEPICTLKLSEKYAKCSGMAVFELTRSLGGWKYEPLTQRVNGGLTALCEKFGLQVMDNS